MTYETIEDAFYFVSSAPPGEHVAVLSRSKGEVYFGSDLAGYDGMPDDLEVSDDYLDIPHKSDLDLGKPLVTEFVVLRCPEQLSRVRTIFSRPGACGRYKLFLVQQGLLEAWYTFEMDRAREALLTWCKERDIRLQERQR